MGGDTFTPDDSVYCHLCDPPHETSAAMIARHLEAVHGVDPQAIANAPIVDRTDPRDAGRKAGGS
jgi:hypothetical protein